MHCSIPKRKNIPKKVRFEIFKHDNFTCQYCGNYAPYAVLNVDHIVPVSKGGSDDTDNLITSCRDCNAGKGNGLIIRDYETTKEFERSDLTMLESTRLLLYRKAETYFSDFDSEKFLKAFLELSKIRVGRSEIYQIITTSDSFSDFLEAVESIKEELE